MKFSLRIVSIFLLLAAMTLNAVAQNPSAKVYKRPSDTDYFGKLFVPKSGKYKLMRNPKAGTTIDLYYGHVDRNRIYMIPMIITEDCYYVDATEKSHVFVVRSTSADDVVMVPATAEDDAVLEANDSFYFGLALGRQNNLRFNETVVTNSVLRENNTYKTKKIYVMANPALRGLAFAWLDQFGTSRNLPVHSLYVLTKASTSASELEVVWPDEEMFENMAAINTVNKQATIDNAVYTLTGQKVGTAADFENLPKGLYIVNGKKVMKR